MSKYSKLWEFIKNKNDEIIELGFDQIKEILEFEIDHSFLKYKKELEEYGYEVLKIFLKDKKIVFRRK